MATNCRIKVPQLPPDGTKVYGKHISRNALKEGTVNPRKSQERNEGIVTAWKHTA
jgi:hypothetical protein